VLPETVCPGPWTDRVRPSPTGELESKVEQLLAQGRTLCRLGLGEPDFPTPDHVKAAAIEAIRTNRTGYTTPGHPGAATGDCQLCATRLICLRGQRDHRLRRCEALVVQCHCGALPDR
jgi:hypothetical protein